MSEQDKKSNELFDKKAKDAYYRIKNSGSFYENYPHLSGIWTKDKVKWLEIYKSMVIGKFNK